MFYFIINPVAGAGDFTDLEAKFKDQLLQFGIEGEFVKTISAGDAKHLAQVGLRKGHKKMVCVGGDGTVNEVVNGVAGHDILLSIIPWGKSNTIAKALGVPVNWKNAIKVLLSEEERTLSLGLLGERFFVAVAGLGSMKLESGKKSLFKNKLEEPEPYSLIFKLNHELELKSNILSVSVSNTSLKFPQTKEAGFHGQLELVIHSFSSEEEDKISYTKFLDLQVNSNDLVPVHVDHEGLRMQMPFEIKVADVEQRFLVVR